MKSILPDTNSLKTLRRRKLNLWRWVGKIILWTLAGIGASTLGLIVVALVVGVSLSPTLPDLPKKAVLWLDLTGQIPEKRGFSPPFVRTGGGSVTLLDITRALDEAAEDPRIIGVVAEVGGITLEPGRLQELRDAVARFRQSGKFSYAWSEDLGSFGGGTLDYYLASAFDEIWMPPNGGVGLTGLVLEFPYFGETLAKLEVQPRFEQRYEYKTAVENLTRRSMSAPARESWERLLNQWLHQIVQGVEQSRPKLQEHMRALIDQGPHLATEAKVRGLVDRLAYWDEFESHLNSYFEEKEYEAIGPLLYLTALTVKKKVQKIKQDSPVIALVQGAGPIEPFDQGPGAGTDNSFNPYAVAEALQRARQDEEIQAVLLRVNSPGGAYQQSDMIRREIRLLREAGKPVVAVLSGVAASGGYYAAMAADHILARPGTITGSIGVVAGKFATEGLWNKLGVNWERLQIGQNAGMWSMVSDFSPSELKKFQAMVDFIYDDFANKAAHDRGLSPLKLNQVARGRVWTGADARRVGLVDELGGMKEAKQALRRLLKLTPDIPLHLVSMPSAPDLWEQVQQLMEGGNPLDWIAGQGLQTGMGERMKTVLDNLPPLHPEAHILRLPPLRIEG